MPRSKVENKREILYVAAFDKNGSLVKAKDAVKKEDYFCPECKEKLILKKSGKTGKGSKRPHFAHYSESPNCTPESVLHKSFKLLLLEKIKIQIADKIPIIFEWECFYCHTKHKGNLLNCAASVKEEYQFENCRADLALLDINNNAFAVIEIVVTHKPEEAAIEFYKKNKIVLIQIILESDVDLDNIDAKINFPTSVNYCFNIQCPNYGEYNLFRQAYVYNKKCTITHLVRTCHIITQHLFGVHHSVDFTDKEIEFAKENGVKFNGKQIYCPHCERIRKMNRRYRRSTRRF